MREKAHSGAQSLGDNELRFLRELGERIPLLRVPEVHLFAPLRQGGVESAVAVLALPPGATHGVLPEESTEQEEMDNAPGDGLHLALPAADPGVVPHVEWQEEERTIPAGELALDGVVVPRADRYVVYTARYRHVQKGPDRGKWEFVLSADADAPLPVLDRVVEGVLRRSGSQGEPVRLSGADIAAAIGAGHWITNRV